MSGCGKSLSFRRLRLGHLLSLLRVTLSDLEI